ncbi:MAG: carboxypeptidase regulatory-like domain-containing protein [Planctomycetota bacterium]
MHRNQLFIGLIAAALIGVAAYFAFFDNSPRDTTTPVNESAAAGTETESDRNDRKLAEANITTGPAEAKAERSEAKIDKSVSVSENAASPEIRGKVVTSESNQAVGGAKIWLEEAGWGRVFFGRDAKNEPAPSAIAGSDGQFKITNPPNGRELRLRIEAPGRVRLRTDVPPVGPKEKRAVGDLTLSIAGQAEGRVTDAAGSPIAKAAVMARRAPNANETIFGFRPPLELETETDASGRYKFDGLPPGQNVQFSAIAENYIPGTTDAFEVKVGSPKQVADLALKIGKEVTGRVLDREGKAVANAIIDVWRSVPSSDFFLDGRGFTNFRTDAEGNFKIAGLDDRTITMNVVAEGKGTATKRNISPGTRDLMIQLEDLGIIRGRVVPAPGTDEKAIAPALASLQINARNSDRPGFFVMSGGGEARQSRILANGEFEITGLDKGKYRVEVSGDLIAPAISQAVEVAPERAVENLQIAVTTGQTVLVKVTKAGTDEPIEDANVRLAEKRKNDTDFPIPGFGGDEDDEEESPIVAIPPSGGRARRSVSVSATATTAAAPAGRFSGGRARPPISRMMGEAGDDNQPEAVRRTVKTDANGIAKFTGLPNATFDISARKTDLAPSMPVELSLESAAAAAPVEQKLTLSEGGSLIGRAARPNGEAAVGQTVELTGPHPLNKLKKANVDDKGNYLFEHLRPGEYRIKLKKRESNDGNMRFIMRTETDDPSALGVPVLIKELKETIFHLEAPMLATVQGVVTQAGEPVAGVKVSIKPVEGGMPEMPDFGGGGFGDFGGSGAMSATTDANGKYKIENVETGKYRVSAKKTSSVKALSRSLTIGSEKETVDLQLPRGVIEGRVFKAEGHAAVGNATVQVIEDSGAVQEDRVMTMAFSASGGGGEIITSDGRSSVKTDAEGRFKIEDLPPGKYKIKASAANLRDGKTETLTLETDARIADVEVLLEKAATLRGRVTGAGGAAKANTLVSLAKKGGSSSPPKITMTDENGVYKFTSLDPGEYNVTAQALGGSIEFGTDSPKAQTITLEAGVETTKDLTVD